jgi:hypothetical protein
MAGAPERGTSRRQRGEGTRHTKGWAQWAQPFGWKSLASTSACDEATSGRPAGTREVGELVGFCRGLRQAGGRWPGPRGTAQQPVTSRVSCGLCKLDHLLPLVPHMVPQASRYGNNAPSAARRPGRSNRGPDRPVRGSSDVAHARARSLGSISRVADPSLDQPVMTGSSATTSTSAVTSIRR